MVARPTFIVFFFQQKTIIRAGEKIFYTSWSKNLHDPMRLGLTHVDFNYLSGPQYEISIFFFLDEIKKDTSD